MVPVLRDLMLSFRETNWSLYLSGVWRAIPFAFDRINDKRWVPLHFEGCMELEWSFPTRKNHSETVILLSHKLREIRMDQALEKQHNPTKNQFNVNGY